MYFVRDWMLVVHYAAILVQVCQQYILDSVFHDLSYCIAVLRFCFAMQLHTAATRA
jgi:hypothetical protein